jgi:hypothetical protein
MGDGTKTKKTVFVGGIADDVDESVLYEIVDKVRLDGRELHSSHTLASGCFPHSRQSLPSFLKTLPQNPQIPTNYRRASRFETPTGTFKLLARVCGDISPLLNPSTQPQVQAATRPVLVILCNMHSRCRLRPKHIVPHQLSTYMSLFKPGTP